MRDTEGGWGTGTLRLTRGLGVQDVRMQHASSRNVTVQFGVARAVDIHFWALSGAPGCMRLSAGGVIGAAECNETSTVIMVSRSLPAGRVA